MVGLGESTICQIVIEVCKTTVEELWSEVVEHHFPKSDISKKNCRTWMQSSNFLMLFLALMVATYQ